MKTAVLWGSATATATALALALAGPARAASGPDADGVLLGAVLGNLLSGKTTLDAKAGEVEGWMMAAPLLAAAARTMLDDPAVSKVSAGDGILFVGAEAPNLGLVQNIEAQRSWFAKKFSATCAAPKPAGPLFGAMIGSVIGEAVGKAPAPSITIASYTVEPNDQTLIDAIQGQRPNIWYRLDDIALAPSPDALAASWGELEDQRDRYAAGACGATDAGKALVAKFDATDAKLNAVGDKGEPSPLDQASRWQHAIHPGVKMLRVTLVKAGGSIINTDTLWTRLGLPAVRLTGAVILGYRLADATSGLAEASGLVVCRAPKTSLSALHRAGPPPAGADRCQRFAN